MMTMTTMMATLMIMIGCYNDDGSFDSDSSVDQRMMAMTIDGDLIRVAMMVIGGDLTTTMMMAIDVDHTMMA